MRDYFFDTRLLHVANVSIDLWRVKDHGFDCLVLKLESLSTVDKLCSLVSTGEDPIILSVLCLSLCFMRLKIYDVNCKKLEPVHIISFMWSSMT